MKAVIMAGGEGTRLRPLTSNAPKPMLPVANRPMIEHVVQLLKRHGFDEIVMTVAFLPAAIKNYFGDGSEFGVSISYADEPTPRRPSSGSRTGTSRRRWRVLAARSVAATYGGMPDKPRCAMRERTWPGDSWRGQTRAIVRISERDRRKAGRKAARACPRPARDGIRVAPGRSRSRQWTAVDWSER